MIILDLDSYMLANVETEKRCILPFCLWGSDEMLDYGIATYSVAASHKRNLSL